MAGSSRARRSPPPLGGDEPFSPVEELMLHLPCSDLDFELRLPHPLISCHFSEILPSLLCANSVKMHSVIATKTQDLSVPNINTLHFHSEIIRVYVASRWLVRICIFYQWLYLQNGRWALQVGESRVTAWWSAILRWTGCGRKYKQSYSFELCSMLVITSASPYFIFWKYGWEFWKQCNRFWNQ